MLLLLITTAEMRRLESDLTKDYWTAREHIPDIVAIESDPVKYLRAEDGDVNKAATRAARYWKHRRRLFGEARWMLPMTQTEGTGALSLQDIQVLRSGYLVMVSMHSGHQILMIDPSRLRGRDPGESRERCLFYLCTNEIKPASTRHGLEMIFLLSRYGYASERHAELIDVLYGALPTKVRHLTILQSLQDGRTELLDFLSFRLEKTFTMFTPTKVAVVRVDSRQTVLDALQRRGIHKRYLPKQLGGEYDYAKLDDWVQTRLAVESAMGAALPPRNIVPSSFCRRSNSRVRLSAKPTLARAKSDTVTTVLMRDVERRRRQHLSKRKSKKLKRETEVYHDMLFRNASEPFEPEEDLRSLLSDVLKDCTSTMSL